MYGLMIALGVLAAVWLMGRRLAAAGHSPDHAAGMAMWAVPAGVVGARLYHVITDWRSFEGRWGDAFKIWEGGLGILGGVIAGAIAAVVYMRRHGLDPLETIDLAAPALPLAQAIGRWGNWFNQELFGKPTDLPWGLEIDSDHRPAEHIAEDTFHPTFLYESLWNIGVVVALLAIERTGRLRSGRLFAAYLGLYAMGRLWIEALRIDTATEVIGLRVNLWVFSVVLVAAAVVVFMGRVGGPSGSAGAAGGDEVTDYGSSAQLGGPGGRRGSEAQSSGGRVPGSD
jgi:prolipoprotein diacylglyceryl transferase